MKSHLLSTIGATALSFYLLNSAFASSVEFTTKSDINHKPDSPNSEVSIAPTGQIGNIYIEAANYGVGIFNDGVIDSAAGTNGFAINMLTAEQTEITNNGEIRGLLGLWGEGDHTRLINTGTIDIILNAVVFGGAASDIEFTNTGSVVSQNSNAIIFAGDKNLLDSSGEIRAKNIAVKVQGTDNTITISGLAESLAPANSHYDTILFESAAGQKNRLEFKDGANVISDSSLPPAGMPAHHALKDQAGDLDFFMYGGAKLTGGIDLGGGTNNFTVSDGLAKASILRESYAIDLGTGNTLSIQPDGHLKFNNADIAREAELTGSVDNGGILSLANGVAGNRLIVSGDFGGTGILHLDIDKESRISDVLTVKGDKRSDTALILDSVDNASFATKPILLATVEGTVSGTGFDLLGGAAIFGPYVYKVQAMTKGEYEAAVGSSATGPATSTYFVLALPAENYFTAEAEVYESVVEHIDIGRPAPLSVRLNSRAANDVGTGNFFGVASGDGDFGCRGGLQYGASGCRASGVWGEIDLAKRKYKAKGSMAGGHGTTNSWELTTGYDLALNQILSNDNRWVVSASASYGENKTDGGNANGSNKSVSNNYGLNLGGTWYRPDGLYLDLAGGMIFSKTDLFSGRQGLLKKDLKGRQYSASVEAGKEFWFDDHWMLAPMGQAGYSRIGVNDFADMSGTYVKTKARNDYWVRTGGTLTYDFVGLDTDMYADSPKAGTLYLTSHVTRSFASDFVTYADGVRLSRKNETLHGDIGFGGSVYIRPGMELYGMTSYSTALSDDFDADKTIGVSAGFKIIL